MKEFYVRYDEHGREVFRREKGKGRPPIDCMVINELGSVVGKTEKIAKKDPTEKKKYIYVKVHNGHIIERKPVTRGRPPLDFIKVELNENNDPVLEDIELDENPEEVDEKIISHVEAIDNLSVEQLDAVNQLTLDDFKSLISYSKEITEDGILSMFACEITGRTNGKIDIPNGSLVSRIDVNLEYGNVSIWKNRMGGPPDSIIKRAICLKQLQGA